MTPRRRPTGNPAQVGETVCVLGGPYSEPDCRQSVYRGTVTVREDEMFRYDLSAPVDLRGFSGAPVVDEKGDVVGVVTVWFDARRDGDLYLEGGAEDAAFAISCLGL